jgi:hypothetical protein
MVDVTGIGIPWEKVACKGIVIQRANKKLFIRCFISEIDIYIFQTFSFLFLRCRSKYFEVDLACPATNLSHSGL